MLRMVSHPHRPLSGHFTCYLNRTYHVLLTRLGHSVDQIDAEDIMVAGERILSKTVVWTAGVSPSPAGKWLQLETDRAGRVRI
jgi:NADH dehydrogenase FAD-containing subunit